MHYPQVRIFLQLTHTIYSTKFILHDICRNCLFAEPDRSIQLF